MSEVYEIVEEGVEGSQEIEVVKVYCKRCTDYTYQTPQEAQSILEDYENFKCPNTDCVSNLKPGHPNMIKTVDVCGACQKPFSSTGQRVCYCPVKQEPPIKIQYDPHNQIKSNTKNPEIQRIRDDIEDSKTNRMLFDKIRNAREESEERSKRIESLLEKMCTLLELQQAKQELKDEESI